MKLPKNMLSLLSSTFLLLAYSFVFTPFLDKKKTLDSIIDKTYNSRGIEYMNCRERDSLTLVALYDSTDGTNWKNPWDLSLPIDTWSGVTLNTAGCVTELNLNDNNLSGEIPSDLGSLNNLIELLATDNELNGSIPIELGNLDSLKILELQRNDLSGNIPSALSNLSGLTSLKLQRNKLNGLIPEELGDLVELTNLELNGNELSDTIPSKLGNLSKLTVLWLDQNDLSGSIPPELGNLTNLDLFTLSGNQLTGSIPAELGNLSNLQELRLQSNLLSGCLPESLLNLCSVDYNFKNNLNLPWQGDFSRFCNGEEQVGASCDDENSATTNDQIQIDCTCLGIDTTTCRYQDSLFLVHLFEVTDGDNWTYDSIKYDDAISEDTIPNFGMRWDFNTPISTWHGVELNENGCVSVLALNNSNLQGDLIDLDLPNLERFSCSHNTLTGAIPDFSNLSNLRGFSCTDNSLTGTIPDFDSLFNLEGFDCSRNSLIGSIPDFAKLPKLENFSCSGNSLTGTIPNFMSLPNLKGFGCAENDLTGTIPDFSKTPKLEGFNCADNSLDGEIPSEIGNLVNLSSLIINDNELTGEIPSTLGDLENLKRLYFQNNRLEGCFPEALKIYCPLDFNGGGTSIDGYNFTGNPLLPWEGDFSMFCETNYSEEAQIGAPCDDDDPSTQIDVIQSDCSCLGIDTLSCQYRDRLTLIELYHATDGPNWLDATNWLSDKPLNEWERVTTNAEGCVTELNLSSNNLTGELPDLELSNLVIFDLFNNEITSVPDFEFLTNLEVLNLYDNKIPGAVPNFQFMPKLKTLSLGMNSLEGELPTFNNLQNLDYLDLSGNDLIGVIDNVLVLRELTDLRLQDNRFTSIIPDFDFPKLGRLLLDSNQLSGDFPILNLPKLFALRVNNNNLSGCIPKEIKINCPLIGPERGKISNNVNLWIQDWEAYWNNGTGQCEDESMTCRQRDSTILWTFNVSAERKLNWDSLQPINTWEGVTLNDEGCVTEIVIENINLNVSIPINFGQLEALMTLVLNNCVLSGPIPSELGNLRNLTDLVLSSNFLTGVIPDGLGDLNLNRFYLNDNQLSGCFPESILEKHCALGNSTDISQIGYNLNGNRKLPSEGNMQSFCDQYQNQGILDMVGASCNDGNSGTENDAITIDCECIGVPPPSCRQLDSMVLLNLLDLPNQQFKEFAEKWDTLKALEQWEGIVLDENGCISELLLSNKNITGVLPIGIKDLNALRVLDISNNELSGNFHEIVASLNNLEVLHVEGNQFTFEPIIPVLSLPLTTYIYAPQDSFFQGAVYNVNIGDSLDIDLKIDKNVFNNNYKLYKKGSNDGEDYTYSLFTKENILLKDDGVYYCEVTNDSASDLQLQSRAIEIRVACPSNIEVEGFDAGEDQTVCESDALLSAFIPQGDYAVRWESNEQVNIAQPNEIATEVEQLEEGDNIFTLFLSIGNCPDISQDEVVINKMEIDLRARDDEFKVPTESNTILDIAENDDIKEGEKIEIIESPRYGEITINFDGSLSFYTKENFGTEDSFIYQLCDDTCPLICDEAEVIIEVDRKTYDHPYNPGFTPNGDGINDELIFEGLEDFEKAQLVIFNVNGDIVFKTKSYKNNWSGINQRNGKELPEGVYYFQLKPDLLEENELSIGGYITILRGGN